MTIEEISKLSSKEVHQKLLENRLNIAKLRLEVRSGKSAQSHLIRQMKKDIARILTVINVKK